MRPLLVVLELEPVERTLLSTEARAGRPGGLGFQGPMHALVASVLFGPARHDAFGTDPESDPPDRETRQPARRECRERRPVVRADRSRQPVLVERRFEDAPDVLRQRPSQPPAAKQEAAVPITDRQGRTRLAPHTANREAAFEVGAPDGVRRDVLTQAICVGRDASNPPTWANEPLALQDVTDRARRRKLH